MRKYLNIVMALVMMFSVSLTTLQVNAAETEEITITGLYMNPNTGIIEDSGGENSFALGQSMVENMMSTTAILEENPDGGYYLTFDFNLYNFISDIEFQSQKEGETSYTDVAHEVVEEQEETVTLKVPVEDMDSLLRASCFVVPMGRSVVFYITYSDTFDAGVVLPDATGDTATDVIADANVDTATTSTSTTTESTSNDVQGITLSSGLASDVEEISVNESGTNLDIIIDGSFWGLLFVLVFCTNLISGAILIAGYYVIKNHLLVKKDDEKESIDEDSEEEADLELFDVNAFELEVNDEENL